MRLSHSAIDLFHQCARRYYWERVLKIKTEDGPHLIVGQLYHNVLEKHLKGSDLDDAVRECIRNLAEDLTRLEIDIDDLDEEVRANVDRMEIDPLALAPVQVGHAKLVESWFNEGKQGLVGKIDLINQNTPTVDDKGNILAWIQDAPCVLDFKVVNSRRKSARDANLSAQLAIYAIETGCNTAGFFEIPRNLEKPQRVRIKTFTDAELAEWRMWITAQVAGITAIHSQPATFFPLTKRDNPLCSQMWCPHWDRCYGGRGKQGDT